MARIGRPPKCGGCGECERCERAAAARDRYSALTLEERRAVVASRDSEKVRERERERNRKPARVAAITRNTRRWRKAHPDRARAHSAVAYALRTGKLVKGPCEVVGCGSTERVHAHHDDYSKPLDVRWLCPLHHAAER